MDQGNVLPPMTPEQLQDALRNDRFTSYVYVGQKQDRGWQVAEASEALLSALLVFRAEDPQLVSHWTRGDASICGLVFGWSDTLHRRLALAETEDLSVVISANAEAAKVTRP